MSRPSGESDRLTARGYDRLLDAAETYREALVIRLCGEVGLRPTELVDLAPASIEAVAEDPARYLVSVNEDRTAYLPTDLERALRRYVRSNEIRDDAPLFDVTPRRLQMVVADVADRASERFEDPALEGVSTGDLRRFFVRRALVEHAINPRVVKAVGGWRSFEALEPYLPAPTDAEVIAAFEPIERESTAAGPPDADDGLLRALLAASDRCGAYRLDEDGYVERWNRSAAALFGYAAGDIAGAHLSTFYTDEDVERGAPERTLSEATADAGTETEGWRVRDDGSRFRAVEIVAPADDDPTGGFVAFVLDVTPLYEGLETARAARADLEREIAVGRRYQAAARALLEASTHEALETAICDELVDGESYVGAWIDRTTFSGHSREWRTATGITADEIDELRGGNERPGGTDRATDPSADAATVDDAVVGTVGGDPFDGALASVPIGSGDTVYGELSVLTTRTDAFEARERDHLETLGRQAGYAIAAVRRRNLLLSDTLVELEFRIRDDRSFFVDASTRLGCRFELDSLVPVSESTQLYYVHLEGASPADVFDLAEADPGIADSRLIETYEGGWRVEFVVEGSSPTLTLTEYGVTVTDAVVDEGISTITAECAADADLRTIVGGLRSAFPTSELVGKREVERSVQTAREFREGLEDRLTDRQEAALRAAYFGGYYDWPRESTAEELADAMGISSPTLHSHLRKGQHELLRTFFDAETVSARSGR